MVGNRISKGSFILISVILITNTSITANMNAASETITVSNNLLLEEICETNLPFHNAIIEENLFIGKSHTSVLLYDITDICEPILLSNYSIGWIVQNLAKSGSFIYVIGQTLAILQIIDDSLIRLHEDVLENESIELHNSVLYFCGIENNLLLLANTFELLLCDLTEGYYPVFSYHQRHGYISGFISFEIYNDYIIGLFADPAGFQGTYLYDYNKEGNNITLIERLRSIYDCKIHQGRLYGYYDSYQRPYFVRYETSNEEGIYVDRFVMLNFYKNSRDTIQYYKQYTFLRNSNNLVIVNLQENVFRIIAEIEMESLSSFYRTIGNYLFLGSAGSKIIYKIKESETLEVKLSHYLLLVLSPIIILIYRVSKSSYNRRKQ